MSILGLNVVFFWLFGVFCYDVKVFVGNSKDGVIVVIVRVEFMVMNVILVCKLVYFYRRFYCWMGLVVWFW